MIETALAGIGNNGPFAKVSGEEAQHEREQSIIWSQPGTCPRCGIDHDQRIHRLSMATSPAVTPPPQQCTPEQPHGEYVQRYVCAKCGRVTEDLSSRWESMSDRMLLPKGMWRCEHCGIEVKSHHLPKQWRKSGLSEKYRREKEQMTIATWCLSARRLRSNK
jgi:ribosomal protein L37AE/L43A